MARTFEANLSLEGMRKLKRELTHYRRVTLSECLKNFLNDLTEVGITVAYQNVGAPFKGYIGFTKEFKDAKYNYKPIVIFYGYNTIDFVSKWYRGTELVEKEVNGLLMAEFGSGKHTDDNTGKYLIPKNFRGTFPEQTHAMENIWYWSEEPIIVGQPVNWKSSAGYRPTMPMWNAYLQMRQQVETIAEYAFQRTTV